MRTRLGGYALFLRNLFGVFLKKGEEERSVYFLGICLKVTSHLIALGFGYGGEGYIHEVSHIIVQRQRQCEGAVFVLRNRSLNLCVPAETGIQGRETFVAASANDERKGTFTVDAAGMAFFGDAVKLIVFDNMLAFQ